MSTVKMIRFSARPDSSFQPMFVGFSLLTLDIPGAVSLKDKRRVLRPLKDKIRREYNVSFSEVDEQDKWQRAVFGLSMVALQEELFRQKVNEIIDLIEIKGEAEVIDHYSESFAVR